MSNGDYFRSPVGEVAPRQERLAKLARLAKGAGFTRTHPGNSSAEVVNARGEATDAYDAKSTFHLWSLVDRAALEAPSEPPTLAARSALGVRTSSEGARLVDRRQQFADRAEVSMSTVMRLEKRGFEVLDRYILRVKDDERKRDPTVAVLALFENARRRHAGDEKIRLDSAEKWEKKVERAQKDLMETLILLGQIDKNSPKEMGHLAVETTRLILELGQYIEPVPDDDSAEGMR